MDDWGNKDNDRIFSLLRDGLYDKVVELLEVKSYNSVLDVGCGDGYFAKKIPDTIYTGIDISGKMIKIAEKKKITNATFIAMSSDNLDFHDNVFDKVVCMEVLEHLSICELEETIKELYRVIRPDGQLIVTVPSINYLWGMLPYKIVPPKHRYGIRTYIKGLKDGYVDEGHVTTEGQAAPHHYRFRAGFLKDMFSDYFYIDNVTTTFWYNNRVIHNILPGLQEKIWKFSWYGKYCGAQLIINMRAK